MNLRLKVLRSPSETDSRAGKNQEISDLPDYVVRQPDAHSRQNVPFGTGGQGRAERS